MFVDEIDAVARHTAVRASAAAHDEREQTLNQLLVEMDGFDTKGGVIVIAATATGPSATSSTRRCCARAGSTARSCGPPRPDLKPLAARGITKVHARGKPLAPDTDLDIIARRTPGFTGADLANVINEGALLTARTNGKQITMASLEGGHRCRVMRFYPERKSVLLSERGMEGHRVPRGRPRAWSATPAPNADPVHKVTIIPRGRCARHAPARCRPRTSSWTTGPRCWTSWPC